VYGTKRTRNLIKRNDFVTVRKKISVSNITPTILAQYNRHFAHSIFFLNFQNNLWLSGGQNKAWLIRKGNQFPVTGIYPNNLSAAKIYLFTLILSPKLFQ
jgi:hypothetical protein